jgi:hypothetical protein
MVATFSFNHSPIQSVEAQPSIPVVDVIEEFINPSLNDMRIVRGEFVDLHNPNLIEGVLVAGGNRQLLGKDRWLDMKGLHMLLDLCRDRKIKSYITHTNLRIDRTTQEIGYFDNFRIKGEHLIADFHFFETAAKHDAYRVEMLKEMIKTMPEEFGVSLVI